jgi:biopolymer transport protein ExbB/TolQ
MSSRAVTLVGSLVAGIAWIGLLTLVLHEREGNAGRMLLDLEASSYPFTIQNVMWIVFFAAAGELVVRQGAGNNEEDQLRLGLLPEDAETVLRQKDLGPIYRRVRQSDPEQQHWLQRLLASALRQFQVSGSVDQVNAMFDSSMELYQHEIDLRYNVLKYLVWLIPTLGFIGTVIGIAAALNTAGDTFANVDPNENMAQLGSTMMSDLTGQLGVAFYTTLLALLQSAGLMFAMHMVQGREEAALNRVGQYCLKNLVNRLYERS